jgi:hypothetical protein
MRLRGQEDRESGRHRETLEEIGPDYSAVRYSAVREPSPYDSTIDNDDAEDRPSVGLSVVAFVICSISGAIVGASITWAAFRLFLPACH